MRSKHLKKINFEEILMGLNSAASVHDFEEGGVIYNQGDMPEFLFYIVSGQVKLVAFSMSGKEAIIGICTTGHFFGEDCLLPDHSKHLSDAVALGSVRILKIEKKHVARLLRDDHIFSIGFTAHLLSRSKRMEENLIDQLFNSTEKRLARTLLSLANFGSNDTPLAVIPKLTQASLAQMVGASRPRVSQFLNKFRDLGFIEYNGQFRVNRSLIKVLLKD